MVYLSKKTASLPANATTTVDAEFEPTGGISVSFKSAATPSNVSVNIKDARGMTIASSFQPDTEGRYVFSTLPPGACNVSVGAVLDGTTVSEQLAGVRVEDFKITQAEVELR